MKSLHIFISCLVIASTAQTIHAGKKKSRSLRRVPSEKLVRLQRSLSARWSTNPTTPLDRSPETKIHKMKDTSQLAGATHLHLAAREDACDTLYTLLKNNTDINAVNSRKETALHSAVSAGKLNALTMLLLNGANVNPQDRNGNTPLHIALERYKTARNQEECTIYKDIFILLVKQFNASRSITNNNNFSVNMNINISRILNPHDIETDDKIEAQLQRARRRSKGESRA